MNPLTSWSSASSACRVGHLDRLHSNLLNLDERLGESVAQAIGHAAAGIVRQVVMSWLGPGDNGPTLLRSSLPPGSPSRPLWETLDEPEERDRPPWSRERDEDDFLADDEPVMDHDRSVAVPRRSLWQQGLAVALPALGWWLHRRAGGRAVGAALGCGLVCGLALYRGGRKAAGTGLALALLTESVRAVAALGIRDES